MAGVYLLLGLLCLVFGIFAAGFMAGRASSRGAVWEKRRELLTRFGLRWTHVGTPEVPFENGWQNANEVAR